MNYTKDPESGVFTSSSYRGINYSDGNEAEKQLYEIISNARDRSTFSNELSDCITDWPSEYHLSRSRHCLLRPLNIVSGDRVLELGGGCGAITRYLGETGAHVVSVEGSPVRAKIAAERCRDLPNVSIYAANLSNFSLNETFDWVLLIGVLEYAPLFSSGDKPIEHYLLEAAKYIAPGGRLAVAIENRLGLKYFNGCSEDHLGTYYHGIQGLYSRRSPQTFGRSELTQHLLHAGFKKIEYLYPFPDYKLPRFILSETGLADSDFNSTDLFTYAYARDYTGNNYRAFDDALSLRQLNRNNLIPEMSNSFLAVCSRDKAADISPFLAMAFSVERIPEFASQTVFKKNEGKVLAVKNAIFPDRKHSCSLPNGKTIRNSFSSGPYIEGEQVFWKILMNRHQDGSSYGCINAYVPWFKYLLEHSSLRSNTSSTEWDYSKQLNSYTVPGDFLDCTPFNLLETSSGLSIIDSEWEIETDIDLGWVVTRSVFYTSSMGVYGKNPGPPPVEIIEELCGHCSLEVSRADIDLWLEFEADFQSAVSGIRRPVMSAEGHPQRLTTHLSVIDALKEMNRAGNFNAAHLQKEFDEKAEWALQLDGQASSLRTALVRLQEEFEEKAQWALQLDGQLNHLRTVFARLQEEFEEKAEWANRLNAQVSAHQKTIGEQKAQIDLLSAALRKSTRIKRRLLLLTAPLDWMAGVLLIGTELIGRGIRRFVPRKPPSFPPPVTAGCSIVILSWEGKELLSESLPACIKSIEADGGDHEIIVVDNGSTDGTEQFVRDNFPEVRFIRLPENLYFSRGNNIGVENAARDIVILLNNDMVVDPGFLKDLLPPFENPNIFSVASQVFFQDTTRRREETGKTSGYFTAGELSLSHNEILPVDRETGLIPVLYAGGGAAAFDRRKFLWLGGLDELYSPFYYEDTDLSYRAWKAGWQCCLAVNSHVLHKHRATAVPRFGRDFVDNTVLRNSYLFLWKNFSSISFLLSHILRNAAIRVRRASVPGNGIRFVLRAYIRALGRLPQTLLHKLTVLRSFHVSDEEVFDRIARPVDEDLCGPDIDFRKGPFEVQLGTGWHSMEEDEGGGYRWMDVKATAFLHTPGSGESTFELEGYVPSLKLFKTGTLRLYLRIGHHSRVFQLKEGLFHIKWPRIRTKPDSVENINCRVSHNLRDTQDARRLSIIVRRLAFTESNASFKKDIRGNVQSHSGTKQPDGAPRN